MRKKFGKLMSLAVAFCLCVSLMPIVPMAHAAPGDPGDIPAGNDYARYPFPQHDQYAVPLGLPDNYSQDDLDQMQIDLFVNIMNHQMITATGVYQGTANTTPNTMPAGALLMAIYHEPGEDGSINVSESQGYGMVYLRQSQRHQPEHHGDL